MSTPAHPISPPPSRLARPLLLLALAAAAGLATVAGKALARAEAGVPDAVSVARFRTESRDSLLHRIGVPTPFTGEVTDHFANGTVKLRSAVVAGRLDGWSEGRFPNGVPELKEHFQGGRPHGVRTTWHANGQKRSEGELVHGRQQGVYRQWHEDGTLAAEAAFDAGQPHGRSRSWHPDGRLKAEALMEHGAIVTRQFYPDGEGGDSVSRHTASLP